MQVVYIHVPLSPSSLIRYQQPKTGNPLRLEGSRELAISKGRLPPGLWLRSPAGWLPSSGINSGTGTSNACIDYRSTTCLKRAHSNRFYFLNNSVKLNRFYSFFIWTYYILKKLDLINSKHAHCTLSISGWKCL